MKKNNIIILILIFLLFGLLTSCKRGVASDMEESEMMENREDRILTESQINEQVEFIGRGVDYEQVYEKYLQDMLNVKFGIADKAPFVQMYQNTMEWSDYTEGLNVKNRGILSVNYIDLTGNGISEMILLVAERLEEPRLIADTDQDDFDTSYYELSDVITVYIYGIENGEVELLMSRSDIENSRVKQFSNAYDSQYKYMFVERKGKKYLLVIGYTNFNYGLGALEYILLGEEDGHIVCMERISYNDGIIMDDKSHTEIITPELSKEQDVPIDEIFYDIYMQPLASYGIEIPALYLYFQGIRTVWELYQTYETNQYPIDNDYPDDAQVLLKVQCRDVSEYICGLEPIILEGKICSFKCFTILDEFNKYNLATQIDWNEIITEYIKENDVVISSTENIQSGVILSQEAIENEVKRIRQVWINNRENIQNQVYEKREPKEGIRQYLLNGEIIMIETDRNDTDVFSRILQIESGELTFAFYESDTEEVRLYFYKGMLFRWIQTQKGENAVIHDNEEENSVFKYYEKKALEDCEALVAGL